MRYGLALLALLLFALPARAGDPMAYWDAQPRRGANSFNGAPPSQAYFDALGATGAEWVRLTWGKWDSAGDGTFLIGDPSDYRGLVEADVAVLRAAIARADASGLRVVMTPLTLPGSVWSQHNGDELDDRIWSDRRYWAQAARYWADLAAAFADTDAVIAYNLVNEPTPERPVGHESGTVEENRAWYGEQSRTPRDLPGLYATLIDAIRAVDPDTPIMLDGGFYAGPSGLDYFPALEDDRLLYAFHMYQPWAATSPWNVRNGMTLTYPGEMEIWGRTELWDAERVRATLERPRQWAERVGVAPGRIVLGEFGCVRYIPWCGTYLDDVLDGAEAMEMHWAFYAFREDVWDAMDYEYGPDRKTGRAMYGLDEAERWSLYPGEDNPVFDPIRRRLARDGAGAD